MRHSRGATSSISGQSSSSGIHQVLPSSFIRTTPLFLTPHFLPERNLPWHARLLESLSLSFPIILIQLWWSLILLYRRRSVKLGLFIYTVCCMCIGHICMLETAIFSHFFLFYWFGHRKKSALKKNYECLYKHLMMFLWLCIGWHTLSPMLSQQTMPGLEGKTMRYSISDLSPPERFLAPAKSSTITPSGCNH